MCFSAIQLQAAGDTLTLDRATWSEINEDLDYTEDVERREAPEKVETEELSDDWLPRIPIDKIKVFLIGFIVLAALVVLILIIRGAKAPTALGSKRIEATTLDEAEENLPDVELNRLLSTAKAENDWRLAIRIAFLMMLQELIYADLIKWHKRKTNQQYARELEGTAFQQEFKTVVEHFDPVWYGTTAIDKAGFERVAGIIENLKTEVKA